MATTLSAAGDAWSDRAGGTSGALWGSLLTAIGAALGNEEAPSLDSITDAVIAGRSAVQRLGGAQVGDKTMVDALVPLVDAFVSTDGGLKAKGEAAVAAGQAGAESTAQLVAKLGRARPLGEKSLGTPDPGSDLDRRVRAPPQGAAARRQRGPRAPTPGQGSQNASVQHRH